MNKVDNPAEHELCGHWLIKFRARKRERECVSPVGIFVTASPGLFSERDPDRSKDQDRALYASGLYDGLGNFSMQVGYPPSYGQGWSFGAGGGCQNLPEIRPKLSRVEYILFECRRELDITTDEEERFEYNGDAEENDSDAEPKPSHNSLLVPLRCVLTLISNTHF